MGKQSPDTVRLRELIEAHRKDIGELLKRRRASNPRLFGSVARGTATHDSDIDVLVDFSVGRVSDQLMSALGLSVELTECLGVTVDVVSGTLLKSGITSGIDTEAVPL